MKSSAIIELIGWVYKDARCPNEANYPNWVVFKLCVNKKYKDKSGEIKTDTSWYECKTNNEGMAKILKQYVKDKMGVLVKGIPKIKAYIDSNCQAQASIEVLVTEVNILTSPQDKNSDKPKDNGRYKISENKSQEADTDIEDDEIPF